MSPLHLLLVTVALSAPAESPDSSAAEDPAAVRQAVKRGLTFVERNKFNFRCISCHDGAWMLMSQLEGERRGFAVNRKSIDLIQTRAVKNYGGHPQFKPTGMDAITDKSINPAYLTVALETTDVDAETAAFFDRVAAYLVKEQAADGHWSLSYKSEDGDGPPAADTKNPDVITMWTVLALTARKQPAELQSDVDKSVQKAVTWLAANQPSQTVQTQMLRILVGQRLGKPADVQKVVTELVAQQNEDGGWSQAKDLPSDALGTGQSLVALAAAGKTSHDPAVKRAWSYLLSTQVKDGSWFLRTRQEIKGERRPNTRAASYMGTAWAALGLMRSMPAGFAAGAASSSSDATAPANPQSKKLDLYRTSTTDADLQRLAERPELQSLDLGHTQITDAGLKQLAPLRQLQSLDLSYDAVTDAGLKDLASLEQLQSLDLSFNAQLTDACMQELVKLAQLRTLNLEGTAVTDAALEPLAQLKQLKTLQLRGTNVTAARAKEFQTAMPGLQIDR